MTAEGYVGRVSTDAAVDEVTERIRTYLEIARGVRAEFSPEQADLDPRVENASRDLGLALGRFEGAFEAELGFVPEVGAIWDAPPVDVEPTQPGTLLADQFSVGMVVGVADGTSPDALDAVLPIIDDATSQLVERLWGQGFEVTEFFVARGDDVGLEGFDTDDEEAS